MNARDFTLRNMIGLLSLLSLSIITGCALEVQTDEEATESRSDALQQVNGGETSPSAAGTESSSASTTGAGDGTKKPTPQPWGTPTSADPDPPPGYVLMPQPVNPANHSGSEDNTPSSPGSGEASGPSPGQTSPSHGG